MADRGSDAPSGAAQRRCAGRLGQFLRHEKLSVEMHLAAALHHSYGRSVDTSTHRRCYACRDLCRDRCSCSCVRIRGAQPTVTSCLHHGNRWYWRQPRHYRFGEPSIFQLCCGDFCATSHWFTSSNEEFDAPLYNQANQEQIAAGETTENIAEIPVVQEQVIVQEIPDVVDSLPPVEEFTEPVHNQVHHERLVAGEMTQHTIGTSAVQQQMIVQEIPPVVEQIQEQIVETIDNEPSSTSTSSSSTSTIRDDIAVMLNSFKNMEKEVEKAAMLTKRKLEGSLREPPLPEPPLVEPPLVEPHRASAKRLRRTWYTPLPGIMEKRSVPGRLYDTLDFIRAARRFFFFFWHSASKLLIILEIVNAHALHVASLSCLYPL